MLWIKIYFLLYILKASILLINNDPKKVKRDVIYFAEKAYEVIQTDDTNEFLAAVYDFYGDTTQANSLREQNDGKTSESYALEAILNSIKQKVDTVP